MNRRFSLQYIRPNGRGNDSVLDQPHHWTERSTVDNDSVNDLCEMLSYRMAKKQIAGYILKPLESVWFNSCNWSDLISAINS